MSKNWNWWSRKLHRWGAIVTALPMLLVIATGVLLQVKKQSAWVQPPTARGSAKNATPTIGWERVLEIARGVPEAEVSEWSDIDRLDVRFGKGIVKIRANNRWEIQADLANGQVLSSTYRRSDLIESLHDGSFFSEGAKLWLFLPNGLILLALWCTGLWLWWIPLRAKRSAPRKKRSGVANNDRQGSQA